MQILIYIFKIFNHIILLLKVNHTGDKNSKKSINIDLDKGNDDELNLSDESIPSCELNFIIIDDSLKDENDKDSFLDDSEIEIDKDLTDI